MYAYWFIIVEYEVIEFKLSVYEVHFVCLISMRSYIQRIYFSLFARKKNEPISVFVQDTHTKKSNKIERLSRFVWLNKFTIRKIERNIPKL